MKKVIEQLVDDLSGDVIEAGEGETIVFSVDGKSYEIDLSRANAKKFREALTPWLSAARKTSTPGAPKPAATRRRASAGTATTSKWSAGYAAVREWAQANGVAVSERGRVADSVMTAYEEAHS